MLGLDALRALKVDIVLSTNWDKGEALPAEITRLIARCGANRGGMRIPPVHLQTSASPVFHKARPLAYGLREAVKANLDELVRDGILEPVQASTWATPIVTPLKASGQPRICGDYRVTVNPHLLQTVTITLDVDSMFEGLHGQNVYTKIDLSNAFLQLPLDEESKNHPVQFNLFSRTFTATCSFFRNDGLQYNNLVAGLMILYPS